MLGRIQVAVLIGSTTTSLETKVTECLQQQNPVASSSSLLRVYSWPSLSSTYCDNIL